MKRPLYDVIAVVAVLFALSSTTLASNFAGKVVALKGKAVLKRAGKSLYVKINQGIYSDDVIITRKNTKLTILLKDSSYITVAEKTYLKVSEFV